MNNNNKSYEEASPVKSRNPGTATNARGGSQSTAERLREQKTNLYGSPKKASSPMKERYQDFTVKFGIVKPEDSELNMSPSAEKSKKHFKFIYDLGRREMYKYREAGSCRNNFDLEKNTESFTQYKSQMDAQSSKKKQYDKLYQTPSNRNK